MLNCRAKLSPPPSGTAHRRLILTINKKIKQHKIKRSLSFCAATLSLGLSLAACQSAPLPGEATDSNIRSSELVSVVTLSEAEQTAVPTGSSGQGETFATDIQITQTTPMTTVSSSPVVQTEPTATPAEGEHVSPDGRFGAQLDTPYTVNGIVLVNKQHHVSANYQPPVSDAYRPLDPTAEEALEQLKSAAAELGYYFTTNSGYRSYELQSEMFWAEANAIGEEEANKLTARPGESEHQTGLAADLTDDNNTWASFTDDFGELDSGKWLAENAYKYGFILRYPKGKEAITGYLYEPWHFRYVGKTIAAQFGPNSTLTLEEYLGEQ